jgi:hypothetical protein
MRTTVLTLAAFGAAILASAQEYEVGSKAPALRDREPDWVELLGREASAQIQREEYSSALGTIRRVLESDQAHRSAPQAVLCYVGLGQYQQARRVIREMYPAWDRIPGGEYSSDSGRIHFAIWAFVLSKNGECPREVWDYFEEGNEFKSLCNSVTPTHGSAEQRRPYVPLDPSPRSLEFMTSFAVATSSLLGPRASERIVREALALWPEHPGARRVLAGQIAARAAFLTEPDGTPARTSFHYGENSEDIDRYINSLVLHITDDAAAREVLAHYRIALHNAPDDAMFKREVRAQIAYWEHWLGIRT